ncbi:hypothetical protein CS911_26550 (plasmid) [Klebsiella variicola]|nr:hypothetical protein [Klebsiella variicola]PHZ92616.1 hypothetical protein CS911_26550 [Klebsiella variicola]
MDTEALYAAPAAPEYLLVLITRLFSRQQQTAQENCGGIKQIFDALRKSMTIALFAGLPETTSDWYAVFA